MKRLFLALFATVTAVTITTAQDLLPEEWRHMDTFWNNVCAQADAPECQVENRDALSALQGAGIDVCPRSPEGIAQLFIGRYEFKSKSSDLNITLTLREGDRIGPNATTPWQWRMIFCSGDLCYDDIHGDWVVMPYGGIGLIHNGELTSFFVFKDGDFVQLAHVIGESEGLSFTLDRREIFSRRVLPRPTAVKATSWGQIKSLSR